MHLNSDAFILYVPQRSTECSEKWKSFTDASMETPLGVLSLPALQAHLLPKTQVLLPSVLLAWMEPNLPILPTLLQNLHAYCSLCLDLPESPPGSLTVFSPSPCSTGFLSLFPDPRWADYYRYSLFTYLVLIFPKGNYCNLVS